VSRPDADAERLVLTRFALAEVVEEARALLAAAMSEQDVVLVADLGAEPLVVPGDRDRILQVFLNLLSNAVKFNVRGGRVEVRAARASAGLARVEVSDSGVGIPADALPHVFERRFRADGGDSGRSGQGLGLAIVRDVLRRHGCRIEVQSQPGQGTRFTFSLPLAGDRNGAPDGAADGGGRPPGLGSPHVRSRFRIVRPG
jgi:signal transduction histidine kinase